MTTDAMINILNTYREEWLDSKLTDSQYLSKIYRELKNYFGKRQ